MRVFIGYGYNQRDRWIEDQVFRLVRSLGCEPIDGKRMYGGSLANEVANAIRSCEAVLGFTTRRESVGNGKFSTHPWVVDELRTAHTHSPPIPFVEVREAGVDPASPMLESAQFQRIHYAEEERAECLVQIAEALGRLRQQTTVVTVRLGPDAFVEEVADLLDDPRFRCEYRTRQGRVVSSLRLLEVYPTKGGLYATIQGLVAGELVQLFVSAPGKSWRSDYELLDTIDIRMRKG